MKYRNKSCNISFFGKPVTDVTGSGYALVTICDEDYLTTAPGVVASDVARDFTSPSLKNEMSTKHLGTRLQICQLV